MHSLFPLIPSVMHGIFFFFSGKNTGMGCHAPLQGIFLTQGSNTHLLCLLIGRQVLYHQRHLGRHRELNKTLKLCTFWAVCFWIVLNFLSSTFHFLYCYSSWLGFKIYIVRPKKRKKRKNPETILVQLSWKMWNHKNTLVKLNILYKFTNHVHIWYQT